MRKSFWNALVLLLFGTAGLLFAGDKSRLDVPETVVHSGLAKSTVGTLSGWKVGRTVSEIAVLSGGYFTVGTIAGTTTSPLDNDCGILFGHPYAKTSYPFFQVDGGGWKKPEMIFPPESLKATVQGDSISLAFLGDTTIQIFIVYRLINQGQQVRITSTVKNTDATSHVLGLGFIIDPALGIRGDGVLSIDGNAILNELWMNTAAISGKSILLSERRGTHAGLKCSLSFSDGLPNRLAAGNWEQLRLSDEPAGAAPPPRLYDLVMKMYWDPVTIAAKEEIKHSFVLSLDSPDFGSGLFTRWDVPSFLTLDDGVMYPSSIPTTVSVSNQHASSASSTIHLLANSIVTNPSGDKSITIDPGKNGFASVPLQITEVYEGTITDLIVTAAEPSQGGIDSLLVPIFIPATPVSDTGLTVTIDSVAKRASSGVSLFFEAERNATKELLYSLKSQNIFLYENSQRIQNFVLGKDTSGGTNSEDIVFVLDVTGSMTNQINGVKNNIKEFADSLNFRGVDYRLALVTFLDIVENVYDFTSNVETFKGYVELQYAHGGGDLPENSLDALYAASQLQYRQNAGRVIIWITDDQYHEKDAVTSRDRQSVINRLLEMDIVVNSIGTSSYQTDWYKPITDPTGGQYYDIRGNFRDILLNIGRLQSLSRYMLTYTSPSVTSGQQTAKLEVHYGGLGGFGTIVYDRPGAKDGVGTLACFPNPFNPQTTIRLTKPALGSARVFVYNVLGQRVRSFEIRSGLQTADIVWDAMDENGRKVASGLYLIRSTVYSPEGSILASGTLKALYLK